MKERRVRVGRKTFLGTTALAASAAALTACHNKRNDARQQQLGHIVYPVLTPDLYDYAGMMATFRTANPHKQLFAENAATLQPATNAPVVYMHMQFGLNSYEFSLPKAIKLAMLGILSGSAVVLALKSEMWQRYTIGQRFGLADTNIYYRAMSNLDASASPDDPHGMYQDWSAQAIIARGGSFMVCHHAMTYFATDCALRHGNEPKSVLDEWMKSLLPGFTVVPSGIMAVQLAEENGWKVYPLS